MTWSLNSFAPRMFFKCLFSLSRVSLGNMLVPILAISVLLVEAQGKLIFSYSSQLSTEFQLLIKTKIPTNEEVSCFKSLRCCIYHAYKC